MDNEATPTSDKSSDKPALTTNAQRKHGEGATSPPPAPKGRPQGAPSPRVCLGPVADLERHLPADWWRTLFNSLYLKTDGDVVENQEATRQEIDTIVKIAGLESNDRILDLCCGQGRHSLELARRGFRNVVGLDRSRYLTRCARKRAKSEALDITFHEGDARKLRRFDKPFHCIMVLGNSFGYFEQEDEDETVLAKAFNALTRYGILVLDVADGEWMSRNFEARSWEWIDQNYFVCRERSLGRDERQLITREVITHAEKGVVADQFYAERLYSADDLRRLLEEVGFQDIRFHDAIETKSARGQDLGMLAHRLLVTARTPARPVAAASQALPYPKVTVLLGDPNLPDTIKLGGHFNAEDMETIDRMRRGLAELDDYEFTFVDHHENLIRRLVADPPEFVFNLCDEGFENDAFKELHIPAVLEMIGVPYTGAGPACLGLCYNKGLVRAITQSLDIPVPMESYCGPDESIVTLPCTFPALVKPNFGDSSVGITKDAVVHDTAQLVKYVDGLRRDLGPCPILVQEFLTGPEYSVGILGNPGMTYNVLPILEVDYSRLDPALPHILGYESKWIPGSPWWDLVQYKQADVDGETARVLSDHSNLLFERFGCRDYARFDFRTDGEGVIKLLEVNPNPGWCWDGKMNIMAGLQGMRYAELLDMILKAAQERESV